MNVDDDPSAVAAAARVVGASQEQQSFRVWDATAADAPPPPTLPSPLYSCGASSRYELLVDAGMLDATLRRGCAERLVAYLAVARACLLTPSVEGALPPLLVLHCAVLDEQHEQRVSHRRELLAAAFPPTEVEEGRVRWRVQECELASEQPGEAVATPSHMFTVHRVGMS